MPISRWILAIGAVALPVAGVLAAVMWRAQMPREPDWQPPVEAAVAARDCARAAVILAAAIDADVPQAFHIYDAQFLSADGACTSRDMAVEDDAGWRLAALPETRDALRARAAYASDAAARWPGPLGRGVLLLAGRQPDFHTAGAVDDRPAYPGIGVGTRLRLIWLAMGCDPVMLGYHGPKWQGVEAALLPADRAGREGAWHDRAQACADDVADLVERIGVGATGADGDLVADLLLNAPHATGARMAYLRAQRYLDHGLEHKWAGPDPDGRALRRQGYEDLFMAARLNHARAAERIGRAALAGALAPLFADMSESDARVAAYVYLSRAQDLGQAVADDLARAKAQLRAGERRAAEDRLAAWRQAAAG